MLTLPDLPPPPVKAIVNGLEADIKHILYPECTNSSKTMTLTKVVQCLQ